MTSNCVICDADADGWYACQRCEQRMRRWLTKLPEDAAMIRGELYETRTRPKNRGGDPAFGSLPGGTDLLSADHALYAISGEWLAILASWESLLREERQMPQRVNPGTLSEVTNWLAIHLRWICEHFAAVDEFYRELREIATGAHRVIAEERTIIPLGTLMCPAEVEAIA